MQGLPPSARVSLFPWWVFPVSGTLILYHNELPMSRLFLTSKCKVWVFSIESGVYIELLLIYCCSTTGYDEGQVECEHPGENVIGVK